MNLKQEQLDKSRSNASCISAAHRMLYDNIKWIFKYTWIFAAAYAVLTAVLYTFRANAITQELTIMTVVGFVVLGLLALCGQIAFYSRVMCILDNQTLKWNIIRSLKMFVFCVCIGIVSVLLLAVLNKILFAASCTDMSVLVIANLALILVITLVLLPYVYVSMKYYMEPESKLTQIIFKSYKTGMRYWLTIFTIMLLTILCVFALAIIISIPMDIVMVAHAISIYGVNYLGDPSGLPSNFLLLMFIVCALTFFIFMYVNIFVTFVCYYMYGTIETRDKERKEFLKEKSGMAENAK
ncbi:MAG: hypothetical protein LUD48_01275 [Prevotella sp.]|nr:hypothetical protein [Prevotella sp.]